MVEGMQRRYIQNGQLNVGGFLEELDITIDMFQELYANYHLSNMYSIAHKMALITKDASLEDDPYKCLLTNHEWNTTVDFVKIQVSISSQYCQVLDCSMIALLQCMSTF